MQTNKINFYIIKITIITDIFYIQTTQNIKSLIIITLTVYECAQFNQVINYSGHCFVQWVLG